MRIGLYFRDWEDSRWGFRFLRFRRKIKSETFLPPCGIKAYKKYISTFHPYGALSINGFQILQTFHSYGVKSLKQKCVFPIFFTGEIQVCKSTPKKYHHMIHIYAFGIGIFELNVKCEMWDVKQSHLPLQGRRTGEDTWESPRFSGGNGVLNKLL